MSFFSIPQSVPAIEGTWVKFESNPDDGLYLDLQYTPGQTYTFLRMKTYFKLLEAAKMLKKMNFSLILFDAYRPLETQKMLWLKYSHHPQYVTDPNLKSSDHMRGAAVDVGLGDSTGKPLDMGTPFDTFNEMSHLRYPHLDCDIKERRMILKQIMAASGFAPITTEWWHYYDLEWEHYLPVPHEEHILTALASDLQRITRNIE